MKKNTNHVGARAGAERKKGFKTSKNTTVFYANCTEYEKQKLSDYIKQIRNVAANVAELGTKAGTICLNIVVLIFCFLMFVSPCIAKDCILQSHNLPAGVNIQIEQTKNSFKVTRCRTSDNYYSLVINDAVIITDDGIIHRLVEPLSFDYVYTGKKHPNYSIYKETFSCELAPIENIRYSAILNKYNECVKIAQIGAFAYPINFKNKKSIVRNCHFKIRIPLLNETTFETTILEFTPTATQTQGLPKSNNL